MRQVLICSLGALALLVASAVTFRLVTGECPVGCLMHHIHGDKPVATQHAPAN
jgi:hypothetical protein